MAYFEWSDALEVGNEKIDHDHLTLVNLVNELHNAIEDGNEHTMIAQTLYSLHQYTKEHFQKEELLMEEIHYLDIDAHKRLHKHLLDQVDILEDAFKRGRSKVASDTAELLRYWLTHHITFVDKKLSMAIKKYDDQK